MCRRIVAIKDEVVLSPDAKQLAWLIYESQSRVKFAEKLFPARMEIWISGIDGGTARRLASFQVQTYGKENGSGRDTPNSIQWTPSGKSISYLLDYIDVWYLGV